MKGRKASLDLTGRTFNELFVLGEGPRINNHPTWLCRCSCGNECTALTNELLSGHKKACGHLRGGNNSINLIGNTYGDLVVLSRVGARKKKVYWRCKCSCGKECDIVTSDLTMGLRKDCGHSRDAYLHQIRTKDISGETFGFLKVIEMLPSIRTGKKWRAMCRVECIRCGNVFDVQKDYLVSGDTQSCGCLKSVGEKDIAKYLNEHSIKYKSQYSFKDLRTPKGGACWFDFGILNENGSLRFLIEYQGKQHFHEMPGPWNFGQYAREVTDPIKREYCRSNNIKLYEIKYDEDIKTELDKIFAR